MSTPEWEERIRTLEDRIRTLEDRFAIIDLIARYGPAADSGDAMGLTALWAEGGEYSFDSTVLTHDELAGLIDLDSHRALMAAGCGHVLSTPQIDLAGDRAVAVNHSVVLARHDDRWEAVRVSANRWELVRTPAGWRVKNRANRLLDGSGAARALLSRPAD